jgi:hypothetical protein
MGPNPRPSGLQYSALTITLPRAPPELSDKQNKQDDKLVVVNSTALYERGHGFSSQS